MHLALPVFCLTYAYLNGLRRAYWEHCRSSVDVLDRALLPLWLDEGLADVFAVADPSGDGFASSGGIGTASRWASHSPNAPIGSPPFSRT